MHLKKHTAGFSLIELLTVLGILTIIVGVATLLLRDIFRFNRNISDSLTQNFEARRAVKLMSAEIRKTSPSSIGAYPLEQVATSSLIFYSNIDSDPEKERVRYYIKNNTLIRGIVNATGSPLAYTVANEATSTLVNTLTNGSSTPLFSYYTDSYAGTSSALTGSFDISIVRHVKIMIYTQNTSGTTTNSNIYTTQVSLRNLKDNL